MGRSILLTDLDNTLFNWVDFFGTSLRAMVHVLARSLRIDEEVIYSELKAEYSRHGTLEFRYVMQQLPSFQSVDLAQQERALRASFVAFGGARRKRLSLYEGVGETLDWLQSQGVIVIAVTNAPAIETLGRLKTLGLSKRLSGLVAWEGPKSVQELLVRKLASSSIKCVKVLRTDELKPDPQAYATAIKACGGLSEDDNIWVIGDSLEKDLRPAKAIGATTIWAKYGRAFAKENFDTLLKVTHWSEDRVSSTYLEAHFEPDFTIESLNEIRKIIPPRQGVLF